MWTSDLNFEPETSRSPKAEEDNMETSPLSLLKTTKQKWHNFPNQFNALTWSLVSQRNQGNVTPATWRIIPGLGVSG